MRRFLIFIFFFLFAVVCADAQYHTSGEDPARIKWRQIVTTNFQVIYPADFEDKAQWVANYLELAYAYESSSLIHKHRKISVILHTHTVISNGMVGWAPRRIEFYTPPYQGIYAQDWLEQLVIHESRHVVQMDKIHKQLFGIVKAVFGEQVSAFITGVYLPFWFIEGDAVVTETALSKSGRGRYPSFLMEHKAQLVEKGVFSLDKAFNGSYRDYVPNHYNLGYLIVGESRARYGAKLWDNVIHNAARKFYSITPVNSSLKQQTGMNQEQLYQSVFDSLMFVWRNENARFIPENFEEIKSVPRGYTHYNYNHILQSGKIVSLKSGYRQIPKFVTIDAHGNEKTIFLPGSIFEESVGYCGDTIVWSEYIADVRWAHSGRTLIRLYDVVQKKSDSFFPEFRGYAPALYSPEKQVAVVEVDYQNNYYLSVYDAVTGKLLARYQTPENHYMFSPAWRNSSELAIVLLTNEGKRLALMNPFKGEFSFLYDGNLGEIKQLRFSDDDLYFISGYSGKNELWMMNLVERKPQRVAKARFDLASPAVSSDAKWLVSGDYTSDGYRLVKLNLENHENMPLENVPEAEYRLAEILAEQEKGVLDFSKSDTVKYPTKPYRKIENLFSFHSWGPMVVDSKSYDIQPGMSIMSQNKLGTAITSLGFKWKTAEKTPEYFVKYEFRGWYPIFTFEIKNGKRKSHYLEVTEYKDSSGEIVKRDTVSRKFSWNQTDFSGGMNIPLKFTKGAYTQLIQPEFLYGFTHYKHNTSTPRKFAKGSLQTLTYRLYYHCIMRQAYMDIQPDWGIITDFQFRHSPFGKYDAGNIATAQLVGYVPGFLKNHGITLYGGFQKRERGSSFSFADGIRIPRGWTSPSSKQMITLTADYKMPLFYPDFNLGKFVYFRRINMALFGDFSYIKDNYYENGAAIGTYNRNISSVGIDLTADVNYLRLYAPSRIGIRSAYIPNTGKFSFGLLFSIDFSSF